MFLTNNKTLRKLQIFKMAQRKKDTLSEEEFNETLQGLDNKSTSMYLL